MTYVTNEVKAMLDPSFKPPDNYDVVSRFGAKDVTDLYLEKPDGSLHLHRVRSLYFCLPPLILQENFYHPRKIMMDTRDRITEVGKKH